MNPIPEKDGAQQAEHPIDRACRLLGNWTNTKLAAHFGLTKGAISIWKTNNEVPAAYCPQIEDMTDGLVRCEELNQKVDWGLVRKNRTALA
jgi:DNA-binding transcriptional regulator YdaS (Cro superfamily)